MTPPAQSLANRLRALHLAGHPLGLSARAARRFAEGAARDGEVGSALRREVRERRLFLALARARPTDVLAVVHGLLPSMGLAAQYERALRSGVVTPLLLLAAVVVSGLLATGSSRAIATLAALNRVTLTSSNLQTVSLVAGALGLTLLLAITFSRRPVAGLVRGRSRLERLLVLDATAQLTASGVALPLAFQASAAFARGEVAASARRAGADLEAGRAVQPGALLAPPQASLVTAAAARGAHLPVLRALVHHHRLDVERELPLELARLKTAALLVGGLALLMTWATFLSTYLKAVTG